MAEDQTNYTDYITRTFSDDVDENSATLPRRNGRTTSLSSVELSSLFEPKEKRLDINNDVSADDDVSTPSKADSEQTPLALTEKPKLLDDKKRKSRTPPGRQKRGLSPAQSKRKVFSSGVTLSGSEFSMMGTITEEGSDDEEEDIVSVDCAIVQVLVILS
jgi:hypothetical protein